MNYFNKRWRHVPARVTVLFVHKCRSYTKDHLKEKIIETPFEKRFSTVLEYYLKTE